MINFEYDGMPYRYFTDEELAAARESLEEQKLLIRIAKNRVGSTKIALGEQLISLYKRFCPNHRSTERNEAVSVRSHFSVFARRISI